SRHQQRVAVWRRARDVESGQCSASACTILDNDALLERDTERLGDHAANRVAGAARTKHIDQGDRLAWIVVGAERWAVQSAPAVMRMRSSLFMFMFLPGCREVCSLARRSCAGARLLYLYDRR